MGARQEGAGESASTSLSTVGMMSKSKVTSAPRARKNERGEGTSMSKAAARIWYQYEG